MERKSLITALQHIAAEQGSDILTDEKRLLAIFSDYYPQELAQKNELKKLCDCHILSEMGKVKDDPHSVSAAIQKLARVLMEQDFIGEERALWMVHDVAKVLKPNSAPALQSVSASKATTVRESSSVEKLASRENSGAKYPYVFQSITFGHYPQRGSIPEPVKWRVLKVDRKNSRILVVSKYALDCKPYHQTEVNITWENCTLRQWLNNDFYNTTFDAAEKSRIPSVAISADGNPNFHTDPGNTTQDKVFLLSLPEVKKYLFCKALRRCKATSYAFTHGARKGRCWWWLRTPGSNGSQAAGVASKGFISTLGIRVNDSNVPDARVGTTYSSRYYDDYDRGHPAVRPALWIDMRK